MHYMSTHRFKQINTTVVKCIIIHTVQKRDFKYCLIFRSNFELNDYLDKLPSSELLGFKNYRKKIVNLCTVFSFFPSTMYLTDYIILYSLFTFITSNIPIFLPYSLRALNYILINHFFKKLRKKEMHRNSYFFLSNFRNCMSFIHYKDL